MVKLEDIGGNARVLHLPTGNQGLFVNGFLVAVRTEEKFYVVEELLRKPANAVRHACEWVEKDFHKTLTVAPLELERILL